MSTSANNRTEDIEHTGDANMRNRKAGSRGLDESWEELTQSHVRNH